MTSKFKVGLSNLMIVGKSNPEKFSHPSAFTSVEITAAELAEWIGVRGFAWMPSILDEGERRYQHKANYAEVLALDVDGGLSIEDAKLHQFIASHCMLAIETASSTAELNKFRLVFRLAAPITDWRTIRTCNLYLQNLVGVADPACKDASRFYFGGAGRSAFILDESKFLPETFVQDALNWQAEQERIQAAEQAEQDRKAQEYRDLYGEKSSDETMRNVERALSCIPPRRAKGEGSYQIWMPIAAALTHEFGELTAVSLLNQYCPSVKAAGWDIERTVRSLARKPNGKTYKIGTIFHTAKDYGFRFERKQRPAKGFGCFVRKAKTQSQDAESEAEPLTQREALIDRRYLTFRRFWDGGLKRDFSITDRALFDDVMEYEGYCPAIDFGKSYADTYLIRGWLGAGKTEAILRSLVSLKDQRPIVWVAPLRSLLRQTDERAKAKGFDTEFYQDDAFLNRRYLETDQKVFTEMCPQGFKSYATGRVDWSSKILAIDEFQQIRRECSSLAEQKEFFRAIRECGLLIVADAFLGDADASLIRSLRDGGMTLYEQQAKKSPVKIKWVETDRRDGEISLSHEGIYLDLVDQVLEGSGRVAIALDNRNIAKVLQVYIKKKYPAKRVQLVCRDTVEENAVFMPNPDSVIENKEFSVDVLIYTPTMKSGSDIQTEFARGLLLCTGVLKPCEMLQAMGRPRKCKEWWVSAPRRTGNEFELTPSLEGAKIQEWAQEISQSLSDIGANAPSELQHWGIWEQLVANVEHSFNSEYIYSLLNEYFETVEQMRVVPSQSLEDFRTLRREVRIEELDQTLKADLARGQQLLDAKQAPGSNADVWSADLASLYNQHPKLTQKLMADVRGDEKTAMAAIEFALILTSRRIQKLKNWIQLIQENELDDLDLSEFLRQNTTTYNSKSLKRRQCFVLMRKLNLQKLVKLGIGEKKKQAEADATHFRAESLIIKQLWFKFQNLPDIKKLFPTCTTLAALWELIKQAMRFFGYESRSKKIRMNTPGQHHPNGKDRKGNQRFTDSKVFSCVGWVLMEESGNTFFRENFGEIVDSLIELIDRERDDRRRRREMNGQSSPLAPMPIEACA